MKLPLAELETSTGAAVLEKMVGGNQFYFGSIEVLVKHANRDSGWAAR